MFWAMDYECVCDILFLSTYNGGVQEYLYLECGLFSLLADFEIHVRDIDLYRIDTALGFDKQYSALSLGSVLSGVFT